MNMEELTKSQIVLLTLLVSFVTSIATGIVTVALIDQAPAGVTQTVSHIIRETVQSAVPAVISQSAAVVQPQKEEPPADPEPDLPRVIALAEQSIARLYSSTSVSPTFLGLGVVIDDRGTVVTDADTLGALKRASVVVANGSSTPMKIVSVDVANGFLYLSPVSTSSAQRFEAAALSSEPLAVGASVIAFSGKSTLRIASGLVVAIGETGPQKPIFTDLSSDSIIKGMPLINAAGEFVGMSTRVSRVYDSAAFVSILPPSSSGAAQRNSP